MKTSSHPSPLRLATGAALLAAFLALPVASVIAAPLTSTTAVHTKPDASAPTLTVLKAGTEPTPAASQVANTPAGWMAVELPGPFEGFVENKDLSKDLEVREGTSIHVAPKADAAVLAVAEKGDKSNIIGVRGRWTQVSLEKKLVGYINVGSAPSPTAAAAAPAAPTPMSPAPVTPMAYGVGGPGQAAPVSLGDTSSLPRQFAGRFVSTRRPLTPRRPYDYALNDDAGKRYAYLDVSKLLLTEQIEKYIDHPVVVFGAAKNAPGTRDIVIQVETLQLK